MIVHFVGSSAEVEKNISSYRAIVAALHKHGAMLSRDWVEPSFLAAQQGKNLDEESDWNLLYDENIQALARADVVVAEVSEPSFGCGYQVATAIQQKKPTLLLAKEGHLEGVFTTGLHVGLIDRHVYTDENVESILEKFILNNTIETKDLRFNFFIDREIYNYLRWTAVRTGKTKAEILRELVAKEIEISNYRPT